VSAYLEAVKILWHAVCAHAIVVDDVSTILCVVAHAARAGTLVVVLGALLGCELEVADASEERLCWPHFWRWCRIRQRRDV